MTPDEIIVEGQAVARDYTDSYPTTKSIMYHRINVRQRELFTLARTWDREFYGVCATSTLVGGAADLRGMDAAANVYPIESLEDVRIEDRGTSAYAVGDRVNVIQVDDIESTYAPRMTLRSGVLEEVGSDMNGVVKIKLFYSRRPKSIDRAGLIDGDADAQVDIADPFDYLLALDLAKDLIRRTIELERKAKAAAIGLITESEAGLLASFEAHVRQYAHARQSQFDE